MVPAIQGAQYFTPLVLSPSSKRSDVESLLSDVDVRVLPFDADNDDWPKAIADVMHQEGFQSPILESGPSTLGAFLINNVVDEICLSITHPMPARVSARVFGVAHLNKSIGPFEGFTLRQLFTDGQTTFSRWRRGSTAS
jgi:riboflavin biosynthesis pyrimidine reductase